MSDTKAVGTEKKRRGMMREGVDARVISHPQVVAVGNAGCVTHVPTTDTTNAPPSNPNITTRGK